MRSRHRNNRISKPELVLPALIIVSAFLPWVVVDGYISIVSTAFDLGIAPVLIGGGIVIGASSLYDSAAYRPDGWIIGGTVVELTTLWALWDANKGITTFSNSAGGRLLADSVSFSYGTGLYLAVVVGMMVILVGLREYRRRPENFALPYVIERLSNRA